MSRRNRVLLWSVAFLAVVFLVLPWDRLGRTLYFLSQTTSIRLSGVEKYADSCVIQIVEPGGIPSLYYTPIRTTRGSILVVHDAMANGNRDPRQEAFCRALARSGYAVLAPRFEELASGSLDSVTSERIRVTFAWLLRKVQGGAHGIAAFGLGTGPTLRAVGSRELRDKVSCLYLQGGALDPARLIDNAFQPKTDLAGERIRYILAYNWLLTQPGDSLTLALLPVVDAVLQEDTLRARMWREALGPLARAQWDALFSGRMREVYLASAFGKGLDWRLALDSLTCPVLVTQVDDDPSVPQGEGKRLAEYLASRSKESVRYYALADFIPSREARRPGLTRSFEGVAAYYQLLKALDGK